MRRECRERFPPPPISKETASWRSRHASRHVRDARAVMHVGIAHLRWRGKRSRHSRRMRTRNFTYLARGPWTKRQRVWDIRHLLEGISLAGQYSKCITHMDALGCLGSRVRVRVSLMYVCWEQMVIPFHLSSYGRNFAMMENVSWLCWTAPITSKCTDVCCDKVSYDG